jgi:hypothetical protein
VLLLATIQYIKKSVSTKTDAETRAFGRRLLTIEKLYLNVENGYPLDANVKLILLDNNNVIIDTLFNPSYIASAMINENYIVYEPSKTILESNQIDINNINSIIFFTEFSTADINEFISIYSSYNIDFVLSAKLKLTIGK